jgi:hypothetical protein
MPAAKVKPLAWSYSRLVDYEACPRKFFFKVIEKRPEPSNKWMERGQQVHTMAENTLLKPKSKIPQDLMRLKALITTLRKLKAVPEAQYTFTHLFKGQTSWFGGDAWARLKIDVETALSYKEALDIAYEEISIGKRGQLAALTHGKWIVDWKTGQFKPEKSVDQLEFYALGAFLIDPEAQFVLTSLAYTDVGRVVHSYWDDPKIVVRLKAKWLKRVAPMQADKTFKPRVTVNCQYCFFSKKVGGPCKAA